MKGILGLRLRGFLFFWGGGALSWHFAIFFNIHTVISDICKCPYKNSTN